MSETPKKRVVRVESAPRGASPKSAGSAEPDPAWRPSPEAKRGAVTRRWIAAASWTLAIALELYAIFWVLKQVPILMWLLLVIIAATGVLSVVGSLLWKQANRLDPASSRDPVRFFVQNQLGLIIAIIAFLPLIILIFMNKNLDGKQKAVAGGIGVVVMLIAAAVGISYESPSQEQYAAESEIMLRLSGENRVYWVKGGSVFHVCAEVPDVNRASQDGQIYEGTVADAHAAGKDRLTQRWQNEATAYCGYTAAEVAAVAAGERAADVDADPQVTEDSTDVTPTEGDSNTAPTDSEE